MVDRHHTRTIQAHGSGLGSMMEGREAPQAGRLRTAQCGAQAACRPEMESE